MVSLVRASPWKFLPTFAAAVHWWLELAFSEYEIRRLLDPRAVVEIRCKLASLWEHCDERATNSCDLEQVRRDVGEILNVKLRNKIGEAEYRRQLLRQFAAEQDKPLAEQTPFLKQIVKLCEPVKPVRTKPVAVTAENAASLQPAPKRRGRPPKPKTGGNVVAIPQPAAKRQKTPSLQEDPESALRSFFERINALPIGAKSTEVKP